MYSLVVGADGVMGRALAARLVYDGTPPLVTTRRPETVTDTRLYLDLADDLSGWRPSCRNLRRVSLRRSQLTGALPSGLASHRAGQRPQYRDAGAKAE